MTLVYEPKSLLWTRQPNICNTSTHTSELTREEYWKRVVRTYKNEWVHPFPDPKGTITVILTPKQCKLLSDASLIGFTSGRRSLLYEDELKEFDKIIAEHIAPDKTWFIRLNESSPKDGIHGCGPLTSAEQIVTSLVTSGRAHRALRRSYEFNQNNILYIIPWRDDWKEELKFRVFVHNSHVTAISQYVWCKDVGLTDTNIRIITPAIVSECNDEIIPRMELDSFVVDVIVVLDEGTSIDDDTTFHIELIEFNSFGKDLAAGSALFHWIHDEQILYGDGSKTVTRYVTH